MIKLKIVDPEGGEASQKSKKLKDPNQKDILLHIQVDRTEDNKGMDLSWIAHIPKKHSKDKDKKSKSKDGCCYSVETVVVHPSDPSKNIIQSNTKQHSQKQSKTNPFFTY